MKSLTILRFLARRFWSWQDSFRTSRDITQKTHRKLFGRFFQTIWGNLVKDHYGLAVYKVNLNTDGSMIKFWVGRFVETTLLNGNCTRFAACNGWRIHIFPCARIVYEKKSFVKQLSHSHTHHGINESTSLLLRNEFRVLIIYNM